MKTKQRGFNLVEMAIILVVVGLILGAAIIPSFSASENDIYENEARRLEDIKTAVVGYAARRVVTSPDPNAGGVFSGGQSSPFTRLHPLPQQRPYLPCPDITGDGYEDRFEADPTGFLVAFEVTVTTGTSGLNRPFAVIGNCYSSRGAVPWRTLGVPPADHWGNLYTYQVDGVWTDSIAGFNKDSTIDAFDQRRFSDSSGVYFRRGVFRSTLTLFNLTTEDNQRPPVVCRGEPCGLGMTLNLAAGKQATANFSLLYKNFNANEIIDGVPFAVLSHGKNGLGAINYARTVADKTSGSPVSPGGMICNEPVDATADSSVINLTTPEAHNFPYPEPPSSGAMCREATVNTVPAVNGFLFAGKRGENFDDIVAWMTREELFDALRRAEGLDGPAPDFPTINNYPEE